MESEISLYTDGAACGNPGPGGYGIVLVSGRHRLEKSGGFRLTTNNRMELLAVIIGLEALKKPGSNVVIYTDSKYVADSVEKGWVFQWESKLFKKKKNTDLWTRFLKIYRKYNVRIVWIKGHNNDRENDLCDRMAVEASSMSNLPDDPGYVTNSGNKELF